MNPAGLPFFKMHGLGNDYVFVDCITNEVDFDWQQLAIQVSKPHFGVGSDGLILILPSEKADLGMRIFNADGSEGEMCGNGIRCVARYAYERGLTEGRKVMEVETKAGIIRPEVILSEDGRVRAVTVDMGKPAVAPRSSVPVKAPRPSLEQSPMLDEEVFSAGRSFRASAVSMGNPHCVMFLDSEPELDELDLGTHGPEIERHELFPNRTNVEFAAAVDRGRVKVRVWERGSGPTLACGTGACAVLVAGALTGRCERKAIIELPGGSLEVEWGEDGRVLMTGPAVLAFEGVYYPVGQ